MEIDYPYVLRRRPWHLSPTLIGLHVLLQSNEGRIGAVLDELATLAAPLGAIPPHAPAGDAGTAPHWINAWLPALDAISIYGLLALNNPRWYVEIGSGHSTRFAARAIADHNLRTRIISIDPQPRAEIDALCDEVLRLPLEDVDPARFGEIAADDVVFADCSHRSFQNSDVTVFLLELVPLLQPGTIYGLHDIFLPLDYPAEWEQRGYNEQYLLAAYLFGGAGGDEILLPASHISGTPALAARLDPLWSAPNLRAVPRSGTGFWMRRGAR